jgi:cytochrome c-type biogenesis protein
MHWAEGFVQTVISGPLLAAVAVAILVGLVGFLSPCVLPLVPGYLSYLAGLSASREEHRQRRLIGSAVLFVLGFTTVFVLTTGVLFAGLGTWIDTHRVALERGLGAATILLGVVFLGGVPMLQRELRIHHRPPAGVLGAPLMGMVFGLAWTPCLTPTFGTVLALSATQGTAGRGTLLTVAYCIGLGVPFVLVAAGVGWVSGALTLVRRHSRLVGRLGGGLLIGIGVLLVFGIWGDWMNALRGWAGQTGVGSGL